MPRPDLTPEQRAEADCIREQLAAAVAADLDELACLLASKADGDLLPTARHWSQGVIRFPGIMFR